MTGTHYFVFVCNLIKVQIIKQTQNKWKRKRNKIIAKKLKNYFAETIQQVTTNWFKYFNGFKIRDKWRILRETAPPPRKTESDIDNIIYFVNSKKIKKLKTKQKITPTCIVIF
jgi:hypothetical protein